MYGNLETNHLNLKNRLKIIYLLVAIFLSIGVFTSVFAIDVNEIHNMSLPAPSSEETIVENFQKIYPKIFFFGIIDFMIFIFTIKVLQIKSKWINYLMCLNLAILVIPLVSYYFFEIYYNIMFSQGNRYPISHETAGNYCSMIENFLLIQKVNSVILLGILNWKIKQKIIFIKQKDQELKEQKIRKIINQIAIGIIVLLVIQLEYENNFDYSLFYKEYLLVSPITLILFCILIGFVIKNVIYYFMIKYKIKKEGKQKCQE